MAKGPNNLDRRGRFRTKSIRRLPEDEDLRLTRSRSAHCRRTLSLARSASERANCSAPDHQSAYVSRTPRGRQRVETDRIVAVRSRAIGTAGGLAPSRASPAHRTAPPATPVPPSHAHRVPCRWRKGRKLPGVTCRQRRLGDVPPQPVSASRNQPRSLCHFLILSSHARTKFKMRLCQDLVSQTP
jgi:hypothetical protein